MTINAISYPTTGRARRRKVAAVLAGGLVLGVGTMATLASWNDSEFAAATFKAGTFALAGSINGTVFTDNTATPAQLPFVSPFSNMQPGSDTYAPFAVQLTAATTNDARVSIKATATSSVAGLSYGLVKAASFTCDKAAYDLAVGTSTNVLVPAGTAVGAVAGTSAFDLNKAAGNTAFLCFKVSAAASGMVQGQSGTGTWEFSADSKAS